MEINATTVLVAVLGGGGLGAILREIISGIGKIARGVSLKESSRRVDLVTERDDALRRAGHLSDERDREGRNRRLLFLHTAHLESILIREGLRDKIPPTPKLEDAITPAHLRKAREAKNDY